MKKFLSLLIITLLAMPAFAKDITIVASPPEGVIKVNGSYYGESSAKVKVKKDDFVIIEVSAPGYETLTTRVYGRDDRKTIEIKLKRVVVTGLGAVTPTGLTLGGRLLHLIYNI